MATISGFKKDWVDLYDGFDSKEIGIGLIQPGIYASPQYAKKKQGKIIIGGIADIVYSGFEHDMNPLVLTMGYEPQYNTVIGINLHYIPPRMRQALIKLVLDANKKRIQRNQPIVVNYELIKKHMPKVRGAVRRYKNVGVRVLGNLPLRDWPKAIKQPSKWENMYRMAG